MKRILLSILALGVMLASAQEQTLLNKTWEQTSGFPKPTFEWSSTSMDASGRMVSAGNTFSTSDENYNFYVSKTNPANGEPFWEV